jgi:hypothetical protein
METTTAADNHSINRRRMTWLDRSTSRIPLRGIDVDSEQPFIGGVNLTTGRIWCVRSKCKERAVVPTFDRSTPLNLGGDIVFASQSIRKGWGPGFLAVDRSGTAQTTMSYVRVFSHPVLLMAAT